jgi:energy-coupling factor transporter ATP-binding protein EcfA2
VSALAHAHRIEVRDLACSRGPAMLFRNVTLEASAGEWVSIRGSNGSGKTTLLRCVAGLTHPDEGSVLWDGQPTAADSEAYRGDLLYAGHLPGIKDDLSAEESGSRDGATFPRDACPRASAGASRWRAWRSTPPRSGFSTSRSPPSTTKGRRSSRGCCATMSIAAASRSSRPTRRSPIRQRAR